MPGSRRFQLAVLTFGHMLVDMYGGFFTPLIPALHRRLDVSLGRLALLAAAGGIVVNGVQPLAGLFIHRLRRPYLLMLSPALAVLVTCIGMTGSFPVLCVLVLASLAGVGAYHPDGLLRAHTVSGEHDEIGVPVFLSGGFFGYSLGALVSTAWIDRLGFGSFALLALPGITLLLLYPCSGLMSAAAQARQMHAADTADPEAPSFWLLLAMGAMVAVTAVVLYTFFTVHLDRVLGSGGMAVGGRVLFCMGLASAFSSYLWGYLSRRVHPFVIVCLTQSAAMPILYLLLAARTQFAALVWGIMLGPMIGGIYPVIATMAKRARGLTPGLRSGLIVGGCWLLASLPVSGCGWMADHGYAIRSIILLCELPLAAAAVLAGAAYLTGSRAPVAGRGDEPGS